MTPSYIVTSSITVDTPTPFLDRVYDEWGGIQRYRNLAPEFGFVIVTWNPAHPDVVREFHWNTADERRSHQDAVGRIVERAATEREKRDGQRQHEENPVQFAAVENAARELADEAARAVTEPRRFHESAERQHALSLAVAAMRQELSQGRRAE